MVKQDKTKKKMLERVSKGGPQVILETKIKKARKGSLSQVVIRVVFFFFPLFFLFNLFYF